MRHLDVGLQDVCQIGCGQDIHRCDYGSERHSKQAQDSDQDDDDDDDDTHILAHSEVLGVSVGGSGRARGATLGVEKTKTKIGKDEGTHDPHDDHWGLLRAYTI